MPSVLDVFDQDAFSVIELNEKVVRKVDYKPQLLGQLNIFDPVYSRNRVIAIAKTERGLTLIPVSQTGEAPVELIPEGADVRYVKTWRLAKGSTIYAESLQGVLTLPFDQQVKEVQQEVTDRTGKISDDLELTFEHMRFGAVQGVVYDADNNTVLINWFNFWGITPPAVVNFNLNVDTTDVRKKFRDIKRKMQRAAKGVWTPATRVGALCSSGFYDSVVNHAQIKETKLGTERAALLENVDGYSTYEVEGVTLIDYRGTDDDSKIAIPDGECRFFPINANGAFQVAYAPAEFFPYVNQRGTERYMLILSDKDRDAWRRPEVYSYPLFICTRPEMLIPGKAQ